MTQIKTSKQELAEKLCAVLGLNPHHLQSLTIKIEADEGLVRIIADVIPHADLSELDWKQLVPADEVNVFIQRPSDPERNPVWIPKEQPTIKPSETKLIAARGIPFHMQVLGNITDEEIPPGVEDGL